MKVSSNMLPLPPLDYPHYRNPCYAESRSQFSRRVGRTVVESTDFPNRVIGQFRTSYSDTRWFQSVKQCVFFVFLRRAVFKVVSVVIGINAVLMVYFQAFWLWAEKQLRDQYVNTRGFMVTFLISDGNTQSSLKIG